MRSLILSLTVFFAISMLSACGHKAPTSLSGTYGPPNAPNALEFHSNGTVTMHAPMGTMETTYRIKDGKVTIVEPYGSDTLTLNIDDQGCLYADGHKADAAHKLCKR